jgi:hypothetical protein
VKQSLVLVVASSAGALRRARAPGARGAFRRGVPLRRPRQGGGARPARGVRGLLRADARGA